MRRFFIFDKYNTWYDWRLTLTSKSVTPPEPKTNYVQLDGAHGTLDLSEALTGEVAYNDRTLTAAFMGSEGTLQDRQKTVRQITAALHGRKVQIVEPDDPEHFFLGRVKVKTAAQYQAYIELVLEAVCEPWRYAVNETVRRVPVSGSVDAVLRNDGDKTLCPMLSVEGKVTLTIGGGTTTLTAGTYKIPELKLTTGANVVGLSGSGAVTFTYREALL